MFSAVRIETAARENSLRSFLFSIKNADAARVPALLSAKETGLQRGLSLAGIRQKSRQTRNGQRIPMTIRIMSNRFCLPKIPSRKSEQTVAATNSSGSAAVAGFAVRYPNVWARQRMNA